jgi:hypothetical protein
MGRYNWNGDPTAPLGMFLTIAQDHSLGSNFLLIEVIGENVDGRTTPIEELAAEATAGTMSITSDTYSTGQWGAMFDATYTTSKTVTITFPPNRCETLWVPYSGGSTDCTFTFSHA